MYTNSYILHVRVCTVWAVRKLLLTMFQNLPPPVRHYSRKATIKVARAQCILTDYICCMPRVDGIYIIEYGCQCVCLQFSQRSNWNWHGIDMCVHVCVHA